jgi:hypothetical protein
MKTPPCVLGGSLRDLNCFICSEGPARECLETKGPLHTRDWEPVTFTLQEFSLVEKAEPVQVHFTLCSRDLWSMWMRDGCKVYMDSYMAPNGSCFMVTWIIFQKPSLGAGLTQDQVTMALWSFTTVGLFYFYHVWGPTWIEIRWNSIWMRARSRMTSHYTWGSMTMLHDFGDVLGRSLDTFFWALTNSWSRLLACVWSDHEGRFTLLCTRA